MYTFRQKSDVVNLIALAREIEVDDAGVIEPLEEIAYVFFTPTGGIPARSGLVCQSADCTVYELNTETGELSEVTDGTDPITFPVWNTFSSPVSGGVLIHAKVINGVLLVDAEDCPS